MSDIAEVEPSKIVQDTGGGCSVCGDLPAVNVEGTYWLCGPCVFERVTPDNADPSPVLLDLPKLEIQQSLTKQDIELLRWVVDAKVRALTALCGIVNNGKGGDEVKQCVHSLAREIANLRLDGAH